MSDALWLPFHLNKVISTVKQILDVNVWFNSWTISSYWYAALTYTNALFKLFFLPQRFIMLLTEHLVRCETGSVDISTPWYKNCIERLQEIFLMVKYSHTRVHKVTPHGVFPLDDLPSLLVPTAPRDNPAVHGNSGEPAVHGRARPPHPGRLPAVLCSAALRHTHTHWHNLNEMCTCVHTAPVLNLHMRNYQLLHQESLHYSLFTRFMSGAIQPVSNVQPQLKSVFKVAIQTSR